MLEGQWNSNDQYLVEAKIKKTGGNKQSENNKTLGLINLSRTNKRQI